LIRLSGIIIQSNAGWGNPLVVGAAAAPGAHAQEKNNKKTAGGHAVLTLVGWSCAGAHRRFNRSAALPFVLLPSRIPVTRLMSTLAVSRTRTREDSWEKEIPLRENWRGVL